MKYNLKNISNSRSFLFGIATLMILFFHSTIEIPSSNWFLKIIGFIKQFGNTGVDIFLFLSAVGLYFSLKKDSNVKNFYIKRIVRILPALLLVNLLWFAYKNDDGIKEYLLSVTGLSIFVTGDRTCWFFTLLIFLYFIYPLLYKLEEKYGSKIYLISIVLMIGINYVLSISSPQLFRYIEIATRRIPIFLIGCFCSKYIYNGLEVKNLFVFSMMILMIICIILLYNIKLIPIWKQIWRYIVGIYAISIIVVISYIFQYIKHKKFIEWIGTYSMESYLLFEKFLIIFNPIIKVQDDYNLLFNIITLIITIIGCIILKEITSKTLIINHLKGIKKLKEKYIKEKVK